MKRWLWIVGMLFFMLVIGPVSCVAILGGINTSQYAAVQCSAPTATSAVFVNPVSGVSLDTSGLTVKGSAMQPDQAKIVMKMAGIVAARPDDFPGELQHVATVIATITATQESTIKNLPAGDLDSAGVFQQRSGWGTYAQRTNVTHATNAFLNALVKVPGWQSMPMGDAAQAVQHSAYPDAYRQWITEAQRTWSNLRFKGDSQIQLAADVTTPSYCAQLDAMQQKVTLAIQACLSQVGKDWQPADGASLVSWCYQQAGINLPNTLEGLVASPGDANSGVETSWIAASDLTLQPGDIPLWGKGGTEEKNATNAGLYVGSFGNTLEVATYNVRGSTHTPATGAQAGPERIKRAASLITSNHFAVVGLQELQPNQRAQLLRSLGGGYGIYPTKPQYGLHQKGINSVNSIIWDKSQVSFVNGSSLPMPYYFNQRPMHIPLVKLQDMKSGQDFYVANTHDPAGPPYAHLRYFDAQQHARDADSVTANGSSLIFTGDFNAAYSANASPNTVWQHKRKNMTWCIMTKSGRMIDGYDASRNPVRTGQCPEQTTRELGIGTIDHVYVSSNIHVSSWHRINSRQATASDHGVTYLDVSLPGTSSQKGQTPKGHHEQYIGVNKSNKVALLRVQHTHLLGAIRLSISTPSVETGSSFVGNDGFPGGSCAVYVEWILARHSSKYHGGPLTNQTSPGYHAAYTVADNLGKLGYLVNNSPAVHATVSFGTAYADPKSGHVAIVAQINQNGSIVVEEANWANYHAYGTHTVPASEVPNLTYAHTEVGWH